MKQIRRIIPGMRIVPLLLPLAAIGCGPPPDTRDQRLAEVAQQSVAVQAKQNEHIARQSQTVAEQSRHLAAAAQQLVSKDAEARQDQSQRLDAGGEDRLALPLCGDLPAFLFQCVAAGVDCGALLLELGIELLLCRDQLLPSGGVLAHELLGRRG